MLRHLGLERIFARRKKRWGSNLEFYCLAVVFTVLLTLLLLGLLRLGHVHKEDYAPLQVEGLTICTEMQRFRKPFQKANRDVSSLPLWFLLLQCLQHGFQESLSQDLWQSGACGHD